MNNLTLKLFFFITLLCAQSCFAQLESEIKAIEDGLTKPIVESDKSQKYSLEERMKSLNVPGVSIAVVKEGKLHWAKAYGYANTEKQNPVNTETIFQAASISKPIAALAVLKLVEEKKLDLDSDVNQYLKGWKVAENEFTKTEKVTLRRLLSHTAGTTVHGFPGYKQNATFPSVEKVLNGQGNTAKVEVDVIPGSQWRYSGGGYTIVQKVIEDVTGQAFEKYLQENILNPLGMTHSTYAQPLPESYHANASAAYKSSGKIIKGLWHNYPEKAAAGLWTTPTDLAKYCMAIQQILQGKPGIITQETAKLMLTKTKNNWGLGPSLAWEGDSLRFQHGGKNEGFTNIMTAFAHQGNAVIIMTSADNGGRVMSELQRAVSSYYGWGISKSKEVKLIKLSSEQLDKYVGKYKLDQQIDGIGDYYVDIVRKGNQIVVIDKNSGGEKDFLSPMSKTSFIDMEDGDQLVFQLDANPIGFKWNNQYQLYKVE